MDKQKIARYIAALNFDVLRKYCEENDIDWRVVKSFDFETPEQVYDCLSAFVSNKIPLNILFLNPDVWGIYLCSIVEEKFLNGMRLLLQIGNPANILYFFNMCYKFGLSAIEDQDYDAILKLYLVAFPHLSFFLNETYDDMEYPTVVVDAFNLCKIKKSAVKKQDTQTGDTVFDTLNSEKSKSVRPVTESQEAFNYWCTSPECDVNFSLKIDGINTKVIFDEVKGGLQLALSRGRATKSVDYTQAFKNYLKFTSVDAPNIKGRITGESFLTRTDLEFIKSKYPEKEFKTPKSTAMSMLRAADNFDFEDYQRLSFCAFNYNELRTDLAFDKLNELGFTTPPNITVKSGNIPRDSLENFNEWLDKNVFQVLWQQGFERGIASDGVVMQLLLDSERDRSDVYSDNNIALKYSLWQAVPYESEVEEIIVEQKRVEASIVLIIKPVITRDSNTATRVGVGSPDILINDNIRVGDKIRFERKSEAYNVYLNKVET